MTFDEVLMIDWSGGNDRGPRPKPDAIWTCSASAGVAEDPRYHRNRQVAEAWLVDHLDRARAAGRRVLFGIDICFGFPEGFAEALTGTPHPFAVWDWLEARIEDSPEANNRFDVAGEINARFPGTGPFWFNALSRDVPHLPRKGRDRAGHGVPERRAAEATLPRAFPVWQVSGAGAVGGQTLVGLPMLARLRRRFGADLAVWPFEPVGDAPLVLTEVWLSLIADTVARLQRPGEVKDAAQVRTLARALSALPPDDLATLLDVPATEEGTFLGLGREDTLRAAALAPPPLRDDCFAMPRGAHWTPVAEALAHLDRLTPVVRAEEVPVQAAALRILAAPVRAARSHPPTPNAAVDGYAFAGPAPEGPQRYALRPGRAAAGAPYRGAALAPGEALRILTGAALPAGADTVVLQEDIVDDGAGIAFHGPLKRGANARRAGEDMVQGEVILPAGRRLTPADLGTLTAAGVARVEVFRPLRVGVLSTGDELRAPPEPAAPEDIYDANRPMLLAQVARWGHEAIDLGRAPDDRAALTVILDSAARRCDAILTSGGASGGEEDHVSALLRDSGSFALWRVAVKPGRPLVLGLHAGVPVVGLPGNPVAALVCTLVFARPALARLSGRDLPPMSGVERPAAFAKSKKAGRQEYLRARIGSDGRVEVFPSEGSGRISGLSWATGLVELDHGAREIAPGDPVRFLPFEAFDA